MAKHVHVLDGIHGPGPSGWSPRKATSADPTTWRGPRLTVSHCSNRRPDTKVRAAVRVLCSSGGGGSRTRVREPIRRSVYVRITPLASRSDEAGARPARASRPIDLVPAGAAAPRDQPDFSTSSGVASGGLFRRRATAKAEPYAASAKLLLAVVYSPRGLRGPGTSARCIDFTERVETVTPPVQSRRRRSGRRVTQDNTASAGRGSPPPSRVAEWRSR